VAGFDVRRQQGKVRQAIGVALQEVGLDPLMTARELIVLQAGFSAPRPAPRATPPNACSTRSVSPTSSPRSVSATTRAA